ncbi:MAG TPA: NADH-quinone oxidoreductase subunit N [Thermodesulfovibrionales bacterium]|nr:NADH-quinone oxidoreductase subunit N [Thermodesulfovibrionales bacterium]
MVNIQMPDLNPLMPEILMICLAMAVLVLDLAIRRKGVVALLSIITAGVGAYAVMGASGETFSGMFIADGYSTFFKLIFLISLVLSILVSVKYIEVEKVNFGEYYALMLFATIGMMIMASAGDIIVLYLGLELMALSTYVLAGFLRHETKSNEASLKYFLLGAFASAILLYGTALIYGLTGTTDLKGIAKYLTTHELASNPTLLLSMIFMTVAFAFKVAAAPFHMWAPDAYEGAPTPITAFMSVGPKAAGFAALGRILFIAFGSLQVDWSGILIPISILTMAVGNILAIAQTNIKRMLAYSSIAHAGYALIGIICGGSEGAASMMNYLFIYAFMNIGAFSVVTMLRTEGVRGDEIKDYEGLAKTHPLAAALMLVFMFSLTGIPPTAGFVGKFYLFMTAVNSGYTWLVIVAVIFSAISAYFYLRIVMYMYMREPKTEAALSTSASAGIALAVTVFAVLLIGVLPSGIIALARSAVAGF